MIWLSYVAALLLTIGILAGIRAAFIPVRDNIDEFMGDLHRQGRWAAVAAILAGAGSLLELALKALA